MTRGLVQLLACVSVLIAAQWTAEADPLARPANAEAQKHLDRGNRFYNVRSFEEAAQEFKAGALVEPAAVFDYNLGQAYRQLGRYQDAIWHYKRFIRLGQPQGELLDAVNKFIESMSAALDKEQVAARPQNLDPVAAPMSTSGAVNRPNDDRGLSFRRKLAIGIGGVGVALVGIGAVAGLHARELQQDAEAICPKESCNRADEANAIIGRAKDNALYANVTWGLGAATFVGATVLWLTSSPAEVRRIALTPTVTATCLGFNAAVRF